VNRYKAIVAYDGTHYHGWQAQKDLPTIAQTMQDAFKQVFGVAITVAGVSRTDAGVHAHGQVVGIRIPFVIEPEALRRAWNGHLPATISIRSVERIANDVNIYDDVEQKTYIYQIFTERPLPVRARYGWHIKKPICRVKLEQALNIFVGTHNFKSFCSDDERGDDTVRTINTITVREHPRQQMIRIIIKGPTFLRYMIRRIVGAALAAATRDDISLDFVREILQAQNPRHMLPNAPAQGLTLWRITYRQ
jgi:tRNA pseudouridine38-40 synthase